MRRSCGWHDKVRRCSGAGAAAVVAAWGRYAGGAAVLPGGGVVVPAGDRPVTGSVGANGAGHRLGVRPAGGVVAAGPAVRGGFRGWVAGSVAAMRAAGERDRGGEGGGALAGDGAAAA